MIRFMYGASNDLVHVWAAAQAVGDGRGGEP